MENGQRAIVASNGVFVQVKRDWLDCVERLGGIDAAMPLPYGKMTPSVRFTFGTIPIALLDAFIAAGRAGLPNEIAGGLIYSHSEPRCGSRSMSRCTALRTASSIGCRPSPATRALPWTCTLTESCPHSGRPRTTWTTRSVKVAGVFGNLDREQPSAAFRLVLNGMYRPLAHPWQAAAAQPVDSNESWPTLDALGFSVGEAWII